MLGIERDGDTYVARDESGVAWSVELRLDMSGTSFREEVLWPAASVVAVAGGNAVHFLAAESGAIVSSLSLGNDLFGHFGGADGEMLYVLGWRNVIAVDNTLAVRWVCHDVLSTGSRGPARTATGSGCRPKWTLRVDGSMSSSMQSPVAS